MNKELNLFYMELHSTQNCLPPHSALDRSPALLPEDVVRGSGLQVALGAGVALTKMVVTAALCPVPLGQSDHCL